jgi:L,D-peptidoglycan transpeptidase YkuD (ErfK/YbiS/YcfS/YnhG family)
MPSLSVIRVRQLPGARGQGNQHRGVLLAGGLSIPCALGRSGLTRRKREGDGASPVARLTPLLLMYRPDRLRRPPTALPSRALAPGDGWCDDPRHPRYNRPVRLPFAASHERMWREDGLYDIVVDLDWNRRSPRPGCGSAIFLHAARPGLAPTEGCVALPFPVLRRLVARIGRQTRFILS